MTLPSSPGYAPAVSRTHRIFPDPQSGYRVNGKFSICLPLGSDVTNGVSNPSLETGITGFTLSGGASIARSTLKQRRGAWSLAITPGAGPFDGAFFGTVATVGSSVYTFSCDFLGAAGVDYRIYVASTVGGAISGYYQFKGIGRWQRVSVTYQENTAPSVATNRRLYFTKAGGASTAVFYVDGLNFTATAFSVTYFDGDSRGFVPGRQDFYWTGTPNGSTSVMSGQTRAGGKLIPLAYFGFTLLAVLGLGMTPLNNVAIPLASGGGAFYQTTVEQDRIFDLVGALTGRSLAELQRRRHDLMQAIKPDNVPFDQPLLLRYTPTDDCGNENGHDLDIVCSYESGMEGLLNNHYQENLDLRFHIWLPFAAREDGWAGTTLGYQQSVPSYRLIRRTPSGTWQSAGIVTGVSAFYTINVLTYSNGRVYAAGTFLTIGGVTVNSIAYLDLSTGLWNAMGSGLTGGDARSMAVLPDGRIIVVGGFNPAGGVANTNGAAVWNPTTLTWSSIGNRAVAQQVVVDPNGIIYATDGTDVWKNSGAAWVATVSGLTNPYGLTVGPDGYIYAGGDNKIRKYSGSAWTDVVTVNAAVSRLAFGPDGTLYALGSFTTVAGVAARYIAAITGTNAKPLGSGLGTLAANITNGLMVTPDNLVYAGGLSTTYGGLTVPSAPGVWNQSTWVYNDSILTPTLTEQVGDMLLLPDKTLYISYDVVEGNQQNATVAVSTALTNTGVVKTYPRLTFTGPGALYQIKNYTTGRVIYFNLALNAGEIAVLDFSDPQNVQFSSNFRPNLLSTILAGSNLDWFLMPGQNNVSLFVAGNVNVNTAAVIAWRNTYHSIDSALNLSVVN